MLLSQSKLALQELTQLKGDLEQVLNLTQDLINQQLGAQGTVHCCTCKMPLHLTVCTAPTGWPGIASLHQVLPAVTTVRQGGRGCTANYSKVISCVMVCAVQYIIKCMVMLYLVM